MSGISPSISQTDLWLIPDIKSLANIHAINMSLGNASQTSLRPYFCAIAPN